MTKLEELEEIVIRSDREAFNVIKNHLLSQNMKSMDDNGCAYRGSKEEFYYIEEEDFDYTNAESRLEYNGLSCAVGVLIKNSIYEDNTYIEGNAIEWPIRTETVIESVQKSQPYWEITKYSFVMMRVFQTIHDAYSVENWKDIINIFEQHIDFNDDGSIKKYSDIFDSDMNHALNLLEKENWDSTFVGDDEYIIGDAAIRASRELFDDFA